MDVKVFSVGVRMETGNMFLEERGCMSQRGLRGTDTGDEKVSHIPPLQGLQPWGEGIREGAASFPGLRGWSFFG